MSVEVRLMTEGHVPAEAVAEVLEAAGCGPVSFKGTQFDVPDPTLPMHGVFALRDPTKRRQDREVRMHHGVGVDRENDPVACIQGEDYTYLVMGSFDGGPTVMKALAEAFGGQYMDDRDEERVNYDKPPAPPAP